MPDLALLPDPLPRNRIPPAEGADQSEADHVGSHPVAAGDDDACRCGGPLPRPPLDHGHRGVHDVQVGTAGEVEFGHQFLPVAGIDQVGALPEVGAADEVLQAYGVGGRAMGLDHREVYDQVGPVEPFADVGLLQVAGAGKGHLDPAEVLESDHAPPPAPSAA